MGRSPCCDDSGLKKGPWTPEEDQKLVNFIHKHGHGSWRALPKLAGIYIYIYKSLSLSLSETTLLYIMRVILFIYMFYICRVEQMREKLQIKVDQLFEARHKEREIFPRRRTDNSESPCRAGQQVMINFQFPHQYMITHIHFQFQLLLIVEN